MKLLLDENLPHPFRHHLRGHQVFTVHYMGWSSIGNGKLLQLAADAGFDALITLDSGVPYQQNLASLPVGVIVLVAPSNDINDLLSLVPTILGRLESWTPRSVVRVP